jgi:hypothetical protein
LAYLVIRVIFPLHQDEGWRLLQPANRGKVVSTKVGCGRYGNKRDAPALLTGGFLLAYSNKPRATTEISGTRGTEDVPYRILLAIPEARNIPYFAMGAERPANAFQAGLRSSSPLGGNVSRGLQSRYGDHRLISVRMRIKKTALYSEWLAFPTVAQAETFVRDNPRFGLEAIEAKTAAKSNALNHALQDAVTLGRFNLGHIDPNARCKRAREYTEICDELEKLRWDLWSLCQLRENLSAFGHGISVG